MLWCGVVCGRTNLWRRYSLDPTNSEHVIPHPNKPTTFIKFDDSINFFRQLKAQPSVRFTFSQHHEHHHWEVYNGGISLSDPSMSVQQIRIELLTMCMIECLHRWWQMKCSSMKCSVYCQSQQSEWMQPLMSVPWKSHYKDIMSPHCTHFTVE